MNLVSLFKVTPFLAALAGLAAVICHRYGPRLFVWPFAILALALAGTFIVQVALA